MRKRLLIPLIILFSVAVIVMSVLTFQQIFGTGTGAEVPALTRTQPVAVCAPAGDAAGKKETDGDAKTPRIA